MKSNNQINVPQAREVGSVGGQMVKSCVPVGTKCYERHIRTAYAHRHTVKYIAVISF